MSIKCRLVLVGILAFAGCASAPKQPAGSPAVPSAAASESGAATALAATAASGAATAPGTEGAAGNKAAGGTAEAVQTVQVAKLADTNPVTCRDMLIHGSNQMRKRCMTRNDWKVYDQAERAWAQDMLMRMQGLKR